MCRAFGMMLFAVCWSCLSMCSHTLFMRYDEHHRLDNIHRSWPYVYVGHKSFWCALSHYLCRVCLAMWLYSLRNHRRSYVIRARMNNRLLHQLVYQSPDMRLRNHLSVIYAIHTLNDPSESETNQSEKKTQCQMSGKNAWQIAFSCVFEQKNRIQKVRWCHTEQKIWHEMG